MCLRKKNQNPKEAFRLLALAAETGIMDTEREKVRQLYDLATCLEQGWFIDQDINLSTKYFTKVFKFYEEKAKEGDTTAKDFLMVRYYYIGHPPVEKDINKYIEYLTERADRGDVDAMVNLAYLYELGEDLPQNYNKSIYFYSLAANKNSKTAIENLEKYQKTYISYTHQMNQQKQRFGLTLKNMIDHPDL